MFALAAVPLNAQTHAAYPPGTTDAAWPGVKLEIVNLVRIDATHLAAAIRLRALPGAPTAAIGELPAGGGRIPANATQADIDSGKFAPKSYSLAVAKLIDESSKAEFDALRDAPSQPYFGPNSLFTTLPGNEWILMGVEFPVPPPPKPNPDGTIPEQKVTFLLPKAKRAIEHVAIPLASPAPSSTPASSPVVPR